MTTQAWTRPERAGAGEPGAHLPFTAPLLAGARGRLRNGTIDYILPNPAGGRGTYVAVWHMASDIAAPTLHDCILAKQLETLAAVTPVSVRLTARDIAAEGYAGRLAGEAATAARAAIRAETLRLWASLLLAQIRGSTIPPREQMQALAELGDAGPGVMTDGLARVAQRLGWEPAALAGALDQISARFMPLAAAGRVHRLLRLLERMQGEMQAEHRQQSREAGVLSTLLERSASRVEQCRTVAEPQVAAAVAALAAPLPLFARWRVSPEQALSPMNAVEETLDGWDRICALWLDATSLSARVGILPEIALLARIAGAPATTDAPGLAAASAGGGVTPATGTELVERNERIRMRELAMEYADG